MKDYYIFTAGRLKRKDNTLFHVTEENKRSIIPINQVNDIYAFSKLDMNSDLLELLNKFNVSIHFFNYYEYYTGSFIPRNKKVSGLLTVRQSAAYLDYDTRLFLAKSILGSASFHMLRNLRYYDKTYDLKKYIDTIEALIEVMTLQETVAGVMGVEGNIRQTYYNSFNTFLDSDFAFDRRVKRPPTDPLNALISFGNAISYSKVLSEIYKTYLDPTISFLHEPSTRRFSLSLDLAEIFKPLLVDPVIFTLVNKKILNINQDFDYFDDMVLLNDSGRKKFIQQWNEKLMTTIKHRTLNRKVSYQYFIRLECYKLIKFLIEDENYKPLRAWW